MTSKTPGATVLVVDDDHLTRRLCRAILEHAGYCVAEAGNGGEALRIAVEIMPSVIILDVMMPGMDGIETSRQLRSDPVTCEIPIIMLSARDAGSDVQEGLDAGADDYLCKPVDPSELILRVRSMARLGSALSELQRSHDVLGEQTRALSILLDFSTSLVHREGLESLLDLTIEQTARLAHCSRVAVLLPDMRHQVLKCAASSIADRSGMPGLMVRIDATLAGHVMRTSEAIVINSDAELQAWVRGAEDAPFVDVPCMLVPMRASERVVGVLAITGRIGRPNFAPQEVEYIRLLSNHAASAIESLLTRAAREDARDSIVVALAKLAEHRDNDTGHHLDRMTGFCLKIAEALRSEPAYQSTIDAEFLHDLVRAAPLHDIGKVAIPDSILLKPGRLTPEEVSIMRTHTRIGTETIRTVLARIPGSTFLQMAEEIAHGHHEWFDGTGYPRGLAGREIPLAARIASLADVYDALTSRRVYKAALPHAQARQIIVESAGKQFDPDVVAAFLRCEAAIVRLAQELADQPLCVEPRDRDAASGGGRTGLEARAAERRVDASESDFLQARRALPVGAR